jgi:hypothetical protein
MTGTCPQTDMWLGTQEFLTARFGGTRLMGGTRLSGEV